MAVSMGPKAKTEVTNTAVAHFKPCWAWDFADFETSFWLNWGPNAVTQWKMTTAKKVKVKTLIIESSVRLGETRQDSPWKWSYAFSLVCNLHRFTCTLQHHGEMWEYEPYNYRYIAFPFPCNIDTEICPHLFCWAVESNLLQVIRNCFSAYSSIECDAYLSLFIGWRPHSTFQSASA